MLRYGSGFGDFVLIKVWRYQENGVHVVASFVCVFCNVCIIIKCMTVTYKSVQLGRGQRCVNTRAIILEHYVQQQVCVCVSIPYPFDF